MLEMNRQGRFCSLTVLFDTSPSTQQQLRKRNCNAQGMGTDLSQFHEYNMAVRSQWKINPPRLCTLSERQRPSRAQPGQTQRTWRRGSLLPSLNPCDLPAYGRWL